MLNVYRMIFALLNAREKVRFTILMGLVLVMALSEIAGVAAILPFMHVISNQDVIFENAYLKQVYEILGFTSAQNFLIFTGAAVFALTMLSLIIKTVTIYALTQFSLMRSFSIADRLLAGFLAQPYPWFVGRHSADLSNKILSETDRMVSFCLLPAMRLIANIASVIAIVGLVFLLEPAIALGSFVLLGGAYALIYVGFRGVLHRVGERRLDGNKKRFHAVQEVFGGIKEVKLMGLEQNFRQRFSDAAFRMAKAQTTGIVLGELPRFLLEGVAFGGMLLLVLFLLIRGDGSIEEILPTLGLLAVAGSRLFPAMQQVYRQVSGIRFNVAALAELLAEVEKLDAYDARKLPTRTDVEALPLREKLALNGVSYSYKGADRQALADVSMEIEAKTTIGLVGGTGAGKTTIVDIILGLIEPATGALEIDGAPITGDKTPAWQKSLGYIPQSIFLSDDTIAGNIAFGVPEAERDMDAVRRAAKIANLETFVTQTLPDGYDTWVGERGTRLSGGERQRVGIARALYTDPDILIMDEATSALDNQTEAAVMDAVQTLSREKTIIMIAHRLSTVKDCDRIFFLNKGRVEAFGTYDELLNTSKGFRDLARV